MYNICVERRISATRQIISPLTASDLEKRRTALADLLHSEISGENLRFYIFHPTHNKNAVSIGIRGKYYGMWLFDANSQNEITALQEKGLQLTENETDMILKNPKATIWEINKRLPRFLKKYYPELAYSLDPNRQKIPTHRIKAA